MTLAYNQFSELVVTLGGGKAYQEIGTLIPKPCLRRLDKFSLTEICQNYSNIDSFLMC